MGEFIQDKNRVLATKEDFAYVDKKMELYSRVLPKSIINMKARR